MATKLRIFPLTARKSKDSWLSQNETRVPPKSNLLDIQSFDKTKSVIRKILCCQFMLTTKTTETLDDMKNNAKTKNQNHGSSKRLKESL
jgi:hypothetical protein